MNTFFQFVILLLLITDFVMLWSGRVLSLIRMSAAQGIMLALILLISGDGLPDTEHVCLAAAVFLLKGVSFPLYLWRVFQKVDRDMLVRPYLGRMFPMLAGLGCLAFSLILENRIPAMQTIFPPMLLPVALSTLFTGLIVVVCSVRALTQVLGYLVMENGLFILGIPLMTEGSVWFELSILLDVFAAVFVMAIAITHINSAFSSTDLQRFSSLRD